MAVISAMYPNFGRPLGVHPVAGILAGHGHDTGDCTHVPQRFRNRDTLYDDSYRKSLRSVADLAAPAPRASGCLFRWGTWGTWGTSPVLISISTGQSTYSNTAACTPRRTPCTPTQEIP